MMHVTARSARFFDRINWILADAMPGVMHDSNTTACCFLGYCFIFQWQ